MAYCIANCTDTRDRFHVVKLVEFCERYDTADVLKIDEQRRECAGITETDTHTYARIKRYVCVRISETLE